MANGFFRENQAARLGSALDRAGKDGLFRIVMIHHPPVRDAVAQHKRLFGIGQFQKIIRRHGAELVLHGHSHLPTLYWIEGRDGPVPVVGASAAGQGPGQAAPAAQWNLFEIDGKKDAWSVSLTRRGVTGAAIPMASLGTVELRPEVGNQIPLFQGAV
jgi:3',5'-cyclic AMP phosphodiesterase CpdA